MSRTVQEHGFDSRPSRTEIAFGLRDEANSLFHSFISILPDRLHLQYPRKLMGMEALIAFRQRANADAPFFDVGAIDDPAKFSKMPRFSELEQARDQLLEFLIAERKAIRARLNSGGES